MSGKTHMTFGANAVWLVVLFGYVDHRVVFLIPIAMFAALLPDIDARFAKIHFLGGGILQSLRNTFRHRGFFHSLSATFLLFILSLLLLNRFHPLLPHIVTLAYLSHSILDGFNRPGVQYFYPLKQKYRLIPKKYAVSVEGYCDEALFMISSLSLGIFLAYVFSQLAWL